MTATVAALVRPMWRTVPWWTLGTAGAAGLLLAGTSRLMREPDAFTTLLLLRAAALVGALGLALLLDDPARHLTTPVPVRRPLRQALRAALVAPFAALWWTTALLLAPAEVRPPVAGITLEAAAACALALAGAAAALRLTDAPSPGQTVAAALLTSAVLAPLLTPDSWHLFATADDTEEWATGHDHWTLLLYAATAAWALSGTEPVRRRRAWGQ